MSFSLHFFLLLHSLIRETIWLRENIIILPALNLIFIELANRAPLARVLTTRRNVCGRVG